MHVPSPWLLLICNLLTAVAVAQPCPTVVTRVGTTDLPIVISAGSEEADLATFFVAGAPVHFPLFGTLEQTAPTTAFTYRSGGVSPTSAGAYPFAAYSLVPDASATVTISQATVSNAAIEDISFTLFEGTFDPAKDHSARLLASTFTPTGNLPALTATLTGGVRYTLVVQSGQAYDRPYPRDYTLTLRSTGELQPTFYTGGALPDHYAYTYLALAGDSTAAVSQRGDFRSLSEGFYSVYGLAYDSREPLPTSLTELTVGCARLSENSQSILIAAENEGTDIPKLGLRAKTRPEGVRLDWQLPLTATYDYFRIERSTDGSYWTLFTEVVGGSPDGDVLHFQHLDTRPPPSTRFYRLVLIDQVGQEQQSAMTEAPANVNSM